MIKYNLYTRLFTLIKILFILLALFSCDFYEKVNNENKVDDFLLVGKNDAPVKIKIFSSLTCPHCANFHIKIVSKIKKEYVDTGKVQLIFIDFPLDQAAFNASILLNCLGQEKQINFLNTIYEKQTEWAFGSTIDEINNNLKKIVKKMGISSEEFYKCVNDEDISDKILNARIDSQKKYSINSTPTIIINEKKIDGSASFEDIKKKIEKLI